MQELVRLHGGSVEASSTEGAGTTFAVRLPFGRAHLHEEHLKPPRAVASTAIGSQAFVQEALRWLPDPHRSGYATAQALG